MDYFIVLETLYDPFIIEVEFSRATYIMNGSEIKIKLFN